MLEDLPPESIWSAAGNGLFQHPINNLPLAKAGHCPVALEHHIDHGIRTEAEWQRLLDDLSVTPTLAEIADRRVAIQPDHQLRSSDWAPIIEQGAAIHTATTEHPRPASHHGLEIELGL